MNRSRLISVVAVAAALSLAACSSTGGTPEAGTTPGTTSAVVTSQQAAGGSSSAGAGSSASGGSSSAGGASSSAGASSMQSSAGSSAQSSEESAAASSAESSEESSEESTETTVTVGSGGLDGQSANWFSTMCTGLAPMADIGTKMGDAASPTADPKAAQQSFVDYFNQLGDAFTDTATKLASTPPPTFDKGPEIAGKIVQALGAAGPALKNSASQLAAAKVTDAASLSTAIEAASASMQTQMQALSLDGYELDPKTEAAVDALPSCKAMNGSAGG